MGEKEGEGGKAVPKGGGIGIGHKFHKLRCQDEGGREGKTLLGGKTGRALPFQGKKKEEHGSRLKGKKKSEGREDEAKEKGSPTNLVKEKRGQS